MRVNYGDDWVEAFYETGHTAWVMVWDADWNIKGSAEVLTENKDFWPPDLTGFQTTWDGWRDGNGDPMERPPDIQPYDWVYGWIDNGATAVVQIGEINGWIHLAEDIITGTISTPWDLTPVEVECHSWGADLPEEIIINTSITPDGSEEFTCSWAGQWDILLWQAIGVGYSTPDGNWVANTFRAGPSIHSGVEGDWFFVADFYPGTLEWAVYESADMSVDPLGSGVYPDYQGDLVSIYPLDYGLDMQVGNAIVVSDGVNQKDLVLELVSMTVFDVEADYMEGTAPEGEIVWAMAGPAEWQYPIEATLTPGPELGRVTWSADYSSVGFDITEEMRSWSYARIWDADGDANETVYLPPPLNPHFTVFPEWEWFDGMDWPDGATVAITVDGKTECTTEAVSWGYFFNGSFGVGCDVVVGDTVRFNDGVTERWHTVRNLAITGVDKVENTVTGTAEEGSHIITWVHGLEGTFEFDAGAEPWQVDFDNIGIDLVELMGGRAIIVDEFGNATAVDWWIPNPHFTVFPEWEWFDGMDWPDGATVVITVDGKPECTTEAVSWGSFFNGGFGEGCDVDVGDKVRFNDGVTERWHTVRNLAITGVDKEGNTVTGIADEGAHVINWVHGLEGAIEIDAGLEPWQVDFDDIGIDLVELMGGRAMIPDEFGNATAVDWSILNPHFTVFPEREWFDGIDWPDGATVAITVDDKPECSTIGISSGGFFNGAFGFGCDVAIGDTVRFNDGVTERWHTVRNLVITGVDINENTVTGMADPDTLVRIWAHGLHKSALEILVGSVPWVAAFDDVGIDLQGGMGGLAVIWDEFGNTTAVDWYSE